MQGGAAVLMPRHDGTIETPWRFRSPSWAGSWARCWRVIVFSLCVSLIDAGQVRAAESGDPVSFVRGFSDEAIALLADRSLSNGQRDLEFRRLLERNFDLKRIGRFVLGKHWRRASQDERAEYHRLFGDFVIATYAARLGPYSGETLEVGDVRRAGERGVTVTSRILPPQGAPIRLDWRLRRTGSDGWQIVDIVVEGVSLALTQRSEFDSVIQRSGGTIDGLLQVLRDKTNRQDPAA